MWSFKKFMFLFHLLILYHNYYLKKLMIRNLRQFAQKLSSSRHYAFGKSVNKKSSQTIFPFDNPQIATPYFNQDASLNKSLFHDVTHKDLVSIITGCLKQKYLVPYQNNSQKAVGILYGPNARPMICLPVGPLGKQGKSLSVHFLVDTAAPKTLLSEEALKAISSGEEYGINVNIWGTDHAVIPTIAEWQGVNILGSNYLRKTNLTLECFYNGDPQKEYCMLKKQ